MDAPTSCMHPLHVQCMGPKTVVNNCWCAVVAALVREVERLNLERHAAASTTTTDRVLGQVEACAYSGNLWLSMSV